MTLNDLNSSQAKLIYLYLEEVSVATIDDICTDLQLKAISVYPLLKYLIYEKKFVKKDGREYKLNN